MKNRSNLAISNSLKDARTSLWRIAENKSVSAGLSESSEAPGILPRQTPGQSGISRISPIFPPHPVAGGRTAHRLTNRTGSAARYELVISFFDAKGNNLGGTSFKGTVKASDYINIPEKQTVMDAPHGPTRIPQITPDAHQTIKNAPLTRK